MSQLEDTEKIRAPNLFKGRIIHRYCLNKEGASRETWHISLDVPEGFPLFRPGDSLGIYPKNSPDRVSFLLQYFHLEEETPLIDRRGCAHPAGKWFRELVEIGRVRKGLLRAIADHASLFSDRERLVNLSEEEEAKILSQYDLCEFLRLYVPGGVEVHKLVKHFSPLMPRLYSLASGPSKKHLELIVARVHHREDGVECKGVCSNYLCTEASLQEPEILLFHYQPKHFVFPAQESSLIMVGCGTGIAPFRAYMQEAENRSVTQSNCWLFFGERQSKADFFYEDFWKRQVDEGRLRLNLAFSRDQEQKIYVQHRMWEEKKEIWRWMEEGAHLLVCGHAQKMAKDVEACLCKIAREEGNMKEGQAEEWLLCMKQLNRYMKDVY